MPIKRDYLISLLAGLLYPLAFSPFSDKISFVALLIYPIIALFFALILQAQTRRQAFIVSWYFGLGIFTTGISWVYVAIHEFGYTVWWLAAIFTAIFVVILALFFALQGLLSFYLLAKFHKQQTVQHSTLSLIILPLCWVFFEWLRTWFLTGFPWLLAGYSQIDLSISGFAPIVGVYGLSFIICFLSACLLFFINNKFSKHKLIALLAISFIVLSYPLQKTTWTTTNGESIQVAMVQGNISQHKRWDEDYLQYTINRYSKLSRPLWDKNQLIVWPENAIPTFYHYLENSLYQQIKDNIKGKDITFVTGLPYKDITNNRYYNALLKVDNSSNEFYFKQHLVPFGEYVPLESLLRGLIKFFNIPMSGFSLPTANQKPINIMGYQVATSICFEDAFADILLPQLVNSGFMLNLSNNSWYGDSFAPHQHLQIARMRAKESERELIRSTTGGISALIDFQGNIKQQSGLFEQSIIEGKIQPRQGATPYVKHPLLNVLILIGLISLLVYLFRKH